MKKAIVFISLSFLLFMTACQSAESKEVMEYHNDFVEEVVSRIEKSLKDTMKWMLPKLTKKL